MSVNINQSFINPTDSFFAAVGGGGGATGPTGPTGPTGSTGPAGPTGIVAGITNISTISTSIIASIPGLLSTSVVVASYIHPGVGGSAQYFTAITEGADQVTFGLGANSANGEAIQWIARL